MCTAADIDPARAPERIAMYSPKAASLALVSIALAAVGCAENSQDEERTGKAAQADIVTNESELNGLQLNGLQLNNEEFNGLQLNSCNVNGLQLNGLQLNDTTLTGISSVSEDVVTGADFIGARMIGIVSQNRTLDLKIDAYNANEVVGIAFYTISYTPDEGTTWLSVCGMNGPDPIQAILLTDRWDTHTGARIADPTAVTIACRGAALAKCTEWGYERWSPAVHECNGNDCHDIPLAELHQACTRMVRADYCGDGVPHTMNGTPIDIWDNFGIQDRDQGSTMPFEAEWTPDGAACITHTRWTNSVLDNPDKDYVLAHCPARWAGPGGTCGDDLGSTFVTSNGYDTPTASRALLRNESDENHY
jgi:hypothetical protein